jgi:hypothetical protein
VNAHNGFVVAQMEPWRVCRPVVAVHFFMISRIRKETENWDPDPDPQSLKKLDPHFFIADLNPASVEANA